MPQQPNFGVRIPVAGPLASAEGIRRTAVSADKLGFDNLWVHDYITWNSTLDSVHISCGSKETFLEAIINPDYTPKFFESVTNLAFVAGITERIRLGVAVLILPYREALVTAKQLACIDVLSNGRLDIGIGQGAAKTTLNTENEVMGVSRATKVRHTREVFEAMREVWTTETSSYEGGHVSFHDAEVFPKPVQQPYPPIWMGGSAEKSLEMIADYADNWLSCWVSVEQFPRAIADIHERLERRDRDPEQFVAGTEIQIYIGDTNELARKEVESTMLAFEEGYAGTTGGFADAGKRSDTLKEIWNSSLVGSTDWVIEEMQRYLQAGCTAFELKFIYHSLDQLIEQWERFMADVAPHLR